MARVIYGLLHRIFEITGKQPWWIGVAEAALAYLVLHSLAAERLAFREFHGTLLPALLQAFVVIGQYVLPIFLLLAALSSAVWNHRQQTGLRSHNPISAGKGPPCPYCGAPTIKRTARRGRYWGQSFWGCSRYPACKGIREKPW